MDSLLVIENLTKAYGPIDVLKGVSLTLDAGQTLALTGESGSGKSTLLHLIGALDQPDGGSVMLDGVDLAGLDDTGRARIRRDRIGLVFQQFNLIPSLTVSSNIAFQARLSGRHDPEHCAMLARRLGIDALVTRYPEELSGGQQQRVAIARALANRPALILADEPTGNLDEATGDAVLDLLLDLVRETGAALMMVTHSTRLAARLDRRLHLSRGSLTAAAQGA
ncbi:ABC transporter ATP-binding protein [Roseicyclus marinus]|uniref:ABC transporter ATP-binding protein n=1 Tax=Roseicyclus marinus TaxID=2161673 RepID=UPI00240F0477|nr:ABC transporter ATP-binding protein [Roseicyclus marinus]MDG3041520.1 ABC transporter ATP-binding protein [Roseicyclus marinus]